MSRCRKTNSFQAISETPQMGRESEYVSRCISRRKPRLSALEAHQRILILYSNQNSQTGPSSSFLPEEVIKLSVLFDSSPLSVSAAYPYLLQRKQTRYPREGRIQPLSPRHLRWIKVPPSL